MIQEVPIIRYKLFSALSFSSLSAFGAFTIMAITAISATTADAAIASSQTAATTPAPATAAKDSVVVGKRAPDFTLPSQEGKPVGLKDFPGKWIVLYFYPKDFTGGCTLEAHNFQRDSAAYAQANAVILGVSHDTQASHKEFCSKEGLSFKLLADTAGLVSERYGSVLNLAGKKLSARNTFLIAPNGKVARIFMDVKPTRHSEEVLAILGEVSRKQ